MPFGKTNYKGVIKMNVISTSQMNKLLEFIEKFGEDEVRKMLMTSIMNTATAYITSPVKVIKALIKEVQKQQLNDTNYVRMLNEIHYIFKRTEKDAVKKHLEKKYTMKNLKKWFSNLWKNKTLAKKDALTSLNTDKEKQETMKDLDNWFGNFCKNKL